MARRVRLVSAVADLDQEECLTLLRAGVFGRLVLDVGADRIEVLPVNYATVDGSVLVRTAPGSLIDRCADGARVLLEVDHVNHERHHGWSVVARGIGERVTPEELTEAERHAPGPPRWARIQDATWFRLRWDEITGRRIGTGWSCTDELPVRRVW